MRRGPRASALAAAAAVLALLAACGVPEAGAAAVVGDRRISQAELHQTTAQVQAVTDVRNAAAQEQQQQPQPPPDQRGVLTFLVLAPFVVESVQKAGAGASENDARELVKGAVAEPTSATLQYFRAEQSLTNLQKLDPARAQGVITEVIERVKAAQPRLNPRYGTWVSQWDGQGNPVQADLQNWIVASPSPTPDPSGAPGGAEPAPGAEPTPPESPSP